MDCWRWSWRDQIEGIRRVFEARLFCHVQPSKAQWNARKWCHVGQKNQKDLLLFLWNDREKQAHKMDDYLHHQRYVLTLSNLDIFPNSLMQKILSILINK